MVAMSIVATMMFQALSGGAWQYARWGMTPEALVAASGGDVQLSRGAGEQGRRGQVLAAGKAAAGPFTFSAEFGFHNGQLSGVYLTPPTSQCGDLQAWLQDLYGAEDGATRVRGLLEWRRPEANTVVAFASPSQADCELRYRAIRHAANAGL